MAVVIIPAHNEERVIGRLLAGLLSDASAGEFEVFVVCNGCTDGTARVAGDYGPDVRIIDIDVASKDAALRAGDNAASGFPRLYVDADIEISTRSARAIVDALATPGILAAAPRRDLVMAGRPWTVRAYYAVWQRLPIVSVGLFGRGVVAVNEEGYRRIADRPALMGDDLYVHSRFESAERVVVAGARSTVHTPRTLADLVRRRTRAALGNTELDQRSGGETTTTGASAARLLRLGLAEPLLSPSILLFVGVTFVARGRARQLRKAGSIAWLRDDSSRD